MPILSRSVLRPLPLVLGVVLAACTSTSLVNLWKDPTQPRQPLTNVVVVAIRKDGTARRVWEDAFVHSLKSHGVTATPSYQIFPASAPDTAALTAAVRSRGFDALLVVHELASTTETRYVPGYLSAEPVTYLSPWTGHYYTYFSETYAPSYVESDRIVRYENELWMTRGAGRLVWSGTTESINPESATDVNKEVAHVIVPALVKSGVVRSR